MSDTPRTDAVLSIESSNPGGCYSDMRDLCLIFERDLTTCQEQLKTAQEHLSESSLEVAWWKRTSKDAEAKLQSANEQLAAEKKLSEAISKDCNETALERNELRGQLARYKAAEAEMPEEPALSESIDDPDGCGDVVAREDYNDLRTFTVAQVAALATARAEERERCAKIAASRESYSMPIPCPDNRPGCCVAHSVPATRDRRGTEIAAAIRALTDE